VTFAGLGIELADEQAAEIRIPGHAVGIEDHVVRHRLLARQIIFGDDHMGRPPLRPRQGLERIFPAIARAQADGCKIVRRLLLARAEAARGLADPALRLERRRARRIASHAREQRP
jgi:hypothetical protein